jgi:hypothetical protein
MQQTEKFMYLKTLISHPGEEDATKRSQNAQSSFLFLNLIMMQVSKRNCQEFRVLGKGEVAAKEKMGGFQLQ